jgi:hypothetical protein
LRDCSSSLDLEGSGYSSAIESLPIYGNVIQYRLNNTALPGEAIQDQYTYSAGIKLLRGVPCLPAGGCNDSTFSITQNQITSESATLPGAPGQGIYVWLHDDLLDGLTISSNTIQNASWRFPQSPIELASPGPINNLHVDNNVMTYGVSYASSLVSNTPPLFGIAARNASTSTRSTNTDNGNTLNGAAAPIDQSQASPVFP